jgi:hypothetical protein
LKIRIQLSASEASASVHDLSDRVDELEEPLRAAVAPLAAFVAREDARTDFVVDRVSAFLGEYDDAEGDVESAEDDDGNVLEGSLDGELSFILEDALDTRSHTWRRGNALLDVLAVLSRLSLTEVRYRLGARTVDADDVADAIYARGRAYGFEFETLEARIDALAAADALLDAEDADEDDDEDDDDDDEGFGGWPGGGGGGVDDEDDGDGEDDDEDDDEAQGASTPLDDEGFPRGGWGRGPGAGASPREVLTADERLYLELSGLRWPCGAAEVLAARARTLAKRHPDPHVVMAPAIAAARTEEFKRLQLGCNALVARCRREGRA